MDRMDMFPTNSQDSGNPDVSPGTDEALGSSENLPESMTSESPILTPGHNEASGSRDITPSDATRSSNMFFGSGNVSGNLMISRGSRRISESPDMSPGYNNSTPNGTPMYRNNSGRYSMSSVGSNSPNSPDTSSISNDTPATPISILSRTIKQSRKVFIGTYLERRYVRSIQAYRDIIVVDKNEQELFKCLNEVREVVAQQYGTDKWLGLTYDMKDSVVQSYKIWVELERVPLGRHWFQLRSIKVQGHAVQLQLKYLRMFQTTERESLNVIEYPSINYREGSANDAVSSLKLNLFVRDLNLCNSISSSLNIAKIAYMTNCGVWTSMFLSKGIKMWASTGAAVGVVAKFMDVEAVESLFQAGYLAGDLDRSCVSRLFEEKGSLNFALKNAHCFYSHFDKDIRAIVRKVQSRMFVLTQCR